MKIQVVIPAAGKGVRLKSQRPKPLVMLKGKPIIFYTLRAFQSCRLIQSIVVAGDKKYLKAFVALVKKYKFTKVKRIVEGGTTRRISVGNALKVLDQDTAGVLIHDSARPFVTQGMIKNTIEALKKNRAVVIAVPVKPTIKVVNAKDLRVKKTLDRKTLWEIQTPQGFHKDVIIEAHRRIKDKNASDDALLVEQLGLKVRVIEGDYRNIKITTEDDLIFAKAILNL